MLQVATGRRLFLITSYFLIANTPPFAASCHCLPWLSVKPERYGSYAFAWCLLSYCSPCLLIKEQGILFMSEKPRNNLPSWQSNDFCQNAQKSMWQLLSCVCENGGAPLNQPVASVCVKQAVILQPSAFQAGCRGFLPRLPLRVVNRLSRDSLKEVCR
jgi:hypothetical protein